jgi:preprotein translocase subunit SecG
MAYTLLTIVHVLVCLFLIVVVLLQSGKAADLAGAFGGMGSQTAFGPRGSATLLSKATTGSAIVFMITSLTLSIMATKRAGVGNTILENHPAPVTKQQPATPAPAAPAPMQVSPGQQGAPGQPGQPSVTLSDPKTGETRTVPLNLPPPTQQQQQPPAKK